MIKNILNMMKKLFLKIFILKLKKPNISQKKSYLEYIPKKQKKMLYK